MEKSSRSARGAAARRTVVGETRGASEVAGCADSVCGHRLTGAWALAHVSVDDSSLVAGETVVELRAVATSAGWVAGLAVTEGVHVGSCLAQTSAGSLEHSQALALPTLVGTWSVTSVTRVVARLAVTAAVGVEAHVALA